MTNTAFIDFATYGVQISPDYGIVASAETIKNRPDVVRNLLAAIEESYQYGAVQHPDEVWAAGNKAFPQSYPDSVKAVIPVALAGVVKSNQAATEPGQPFVYVSPTVWSKSIELMKQINAAKNIGQPGDYLASGFAPKRT